MKKKKLFILTPKFMGGFLVAIMLLSLVGVFSSNLKQEESKKYKDKIFYPINNVWFTYHNSKQIPFNYLPQELENITSVPVNFNTQKVYLLTDPNTKNITFSSGKQRIAQQLQEDNIRIVEACTTETNCPEILPIKNCDTLDTPAILFKQGATTRISKEYMCYVIEADTSLNLYKATERLIYQYIGVME
jgi:hypothetical protein